MHPCESHTYTMYAIPYNWVWPHCELVNPSHGIGMAKDVVNTCFKVSAQYCIDFTCW